jgi:hypothetical protein
LFYVEEGFLTQKRKKGKLKTTTIKLNLTYFSNSLFLVQSVSCLQLYPGFSLLSVDVQLGIKIMILCLLVRIMVSYFGGLRNMKTGMMITNKLPGP